MENFICISLVSKTKQYDAQTKRNVTKLSSSSCRGFCALKLSWPAVDGGGLSRMELAERGHPRGARLVQTQCGGKMTTFGNH